MSRDTVSYLIDYFSIPQFLLSIVAWSQQARYMLSKPVSLYTVNTSGLESVSELQQAGFYNAKCVRTYFISEFHSSHRSQQPGTHTLKSQFWRILSTAPAIQASFWIEDRILTNLGGQFWVYRSSSSTLEIGLKHRSLILMMPLSIARCSYLRPSNW